MLALMRRKGESFEIYPNGLSPDMTVAELFAGGSIRIEVTKTTDAQCKFGINAPSELKIVRSELLGTNTQGKS